jgi:CheY-like chemotaxis protein
MANPNPAKSDAAPGSVFWFELPAAATPSPAPPNVMRRASSGWRVLLVDDFKVNLDIIGSFLRAAGHTVILAGSGQEAVRLATDRQFDLILMDMRMPEMDGLEAARRIRLLPGASGQVPILALSAYTSPEQVTHCLDAGMDGHVPKPVDYETLMREIDDTIARSARNLILGLSSPVAGPSREDDRAG